MRTRLLLALFLFSSPVLAQMTTKAAAPGAANILDCVRSLRDQNGGGCIEASSVPTSGLLFPYPGIDCTFTAPAVVAGGTSNTASGARSSVGGGFSNVASASGTTVGGGEYNTASNSYATVGGGFINDAFGLASFIGGGSGNQAGSNATVGGGGGNDASGESATIGGGGFNTAGFQCTVGGGRYNTATGGYSTVGGGSYNTAIASWSIVGGGRGNTASWSWATVGGGRDNTASAASSTVSGGRDNAASGAYGFAAGRRSKVNHQGAFVWGDSFDGDKTSSAADEFNVYASGGTRIFSDTAATTGVLLAAGGGSWTTVSDRNAKENITLVDPQQVLERLAEIPVSTWNYKAQGDGIRHMGPMAQDFYAAFGLGLGDTSIDTIDPDGVALAAIQGLQAKLEDAVARKDAQIVALHARLEELESIHLSESGE